MSNRESSNAVSFSFDGPKNVDLQAIQSAIEAEVGEVEAPAEPVEAKVAVDATTEAAITQEESVEAAESAQSEPTETRVESQPEVRTHKIVVDGQELEVTEADLKSGHMRHRDYTQKTQALAERERGLTAREQAWQKEIEARDRELAQIDEFLKNQAAVDAYRERAFGQRQVEMPVVDPSKPVTPEMVAEIARYNAEQARLANQQQILALRDEIVKTRQQNIEDKKAIEVEKAGTVVDAYIKGLLDKFPVLKQIDDIESILIADASKYGPKGMDEAKTQLSAAAERRFVAIRKIADEEKKQAAIKAAEVKRKSTQPPGGTAPRPVSGKKLTLDSKDTKALRAAAEEDLKAFLGKD